MTEKNAKSPTGFFKVLLPGLSAGLVLGFSLILFSFSLAALLFSGDLSHYIGQGISLLLIGSFVVGLVGILTSSFPSMINVPQDTPAVLLSAEIATISTIMLANGGGDDFFITAVGVIVFTSLLTGATLFLMGMFDLGSVARYLPYPVIGGFLSGAGWLMVKGGLSVGGVSFSFLSLPNLLKPEVLPFLVAVAVFGIALFVLDRLIDHFAVLPIGIISAIIGFHIVVLVSGSSLDEMASAGWLFESMSFDKSPLLGIGFNALANANWSVILNHLPQLGAVVIISVISLLLNISGIEFATKDEMNLRREMYSNGLANVLAGFTGSIIAYPSLGETLLNARIGARNRISGLIAVFLVGVSFFYTDVLVSIFPKFVLGGVVVFLGLTLMEDWLLKTINKVSLWEYGIILAIFLAMNILGTLTGVGIGLLLAIILFVMNYSQIDVIKYSITAENYRSSVDRDSVYANLLRSKGNWLHILHLQGYIFFGTANKLNDYVNDLIEADTKNDMKYLVLSLRSVTGMDAAALQSLKRLLSLFERYSVQIVLVSVSDRILQMIEKSYQDEEVQTWKVFENLDYGVEWCENEMVQTYQDAGLAQFSRPKTKKLTVSEERKDRLAGLMNYLEDRGEEVVEEEQTLVERLKPYLKQENVAANEIIIKKGKRLRGLYFIEGGSVRVEIEGLDGKPVRLRKMDAGSVVGEVSLYGKKETTADVIAEEDCEIYFLAKSKIKKIEEEDMALANDLHKFLTELLGYRTASSTDTIRTLLD